MRNLSLTVLAVVAGVSLAQDLYDTSALGFNLTRCKGVFESSLNLLMLNCYDEQGQKIEEYRRIFVNPLESQCNQTDVSAFIDPSQGGGQVQPEQPVAPEGTDGNATVIIDPNEQEGEPEQPTVIDETAEDATVNTQEEPAVVDGEGEGEGEGEAEGETTDDQVPPTEEQPVEPQQPTDGQEPTGGQTVNCCHYYLSGAGYEFSVCDGLGAVILQSQVGSEQDLMFQSQPMKQAELGFIWQDFSNMVDNFCSARQQQIGQQITIAQIWQSLNIDMSQWQGQPMETLEQLQSWLQNYGTFLDSLKGAIANLPETALAADIIQHVNVTQPEAFPNLTMQDLSTRYRAFYQGFLSWFDQFFGEQGIMSQVQIVELQDGEHKLNGIDIAGSEGSPSMSFVSDIGSAVQLQLEQLVEWVNTHFGSILIQGSCSICQSFGGNQTQPQPEVPPEGGEEQPTNATSLFLPDLYFVPEQCELVDADANNTLNTTVCCSSEDGSRAGCYKLDTINVLWMEQLGQVCPLINQTLMTCGEGDIACAQQSLFTAFQGQGQNMTEAFIFLSFDDKYAGILYDECKANHSTEFALDNATFVTAFDYAFGNLTQQEQQPEEEVPPPQGEETPEQPPAEEQPAEEVPAEEQPVVPAEDQANGVTEETDSVLSDPGTTTEGGR